MRLALAACLLAALAVLLLGSTGDVRGIWHSARAVGPAGFAGVTVFHLALMGLMGMAWWLLEASPFTRWPRFAWGRVVRDSAAEVLPLSQLGGYVLGARAAVLAGVSGPFAAASTVVDVTAELVAQLGYTGLGLLLLERLRPASGLAVPAWAAVLAMTGLAALFISAQRRGIGAAERGGVRLARVLLGRELGGAGPVQSCMDALHARRPVLLAASGIHAAAWLLNGVETWLTLRLMGARLGLPEAVTVDSLVYGIRSIAFLIPSGLGVQEGGLILLGGLFGVDADTALALSLVKRARDVAIGLPALLAWQGLEGQRAWAKR